MGRQVHCDETSWHNGGLYPAGRAPLFRSAVSRESEQAVTHRSEREYHTKLARSTTKVAVRIRLKRMGKVHAPFYRVVVVDSRKKRDGRVIEEIGVYNPIPNPSVIEIESDRAQYWLGVGAQPSDSVRRLLVLSGDIARFNGKEDAVSRIQVAEVDQEEKVKEAVNAAEATAQKAKAAAAKEKADAEAEAAAAKAEAEAATAEAEKTEEDEASEAPESE